MLDIKPGPLVLYTSALITGLQEVYTYSAVYTAEVSLHSYMSPHIWTLLIFGDFSLSSFQMYMFKIGSEVLNSLKIWGLDRFGRVELDR